VLAEEAIETFTETGDHRGLAEALRLFGLMRARQGCMTEAVAAFERTLHLPGWGARPPILVPVLCEGPLPVTEAIARLQELTRSRPDDWMLESTAACWTSSLVAMTGRFDEARELAERYGRYFA